jgi:class 3 adenylate cyclase/tetratricopeptide (TPR) repeat protein
MECLRCQTRNRDAARFCEHCGNRLVLTCPSCGADIAANNHFCRTCGVSLAAHFPQQFASPTTYTPKHLVEKILTTKSTLEGERKQVTVLFVDLSGFTSLSARLDPEEIHGLMNRAFELMLTEVHRYEGNVNQFLGDGIMALFGAPISHEDHAQRAVHAALGIRKALDVYEQELQQSHGIPFQVRQGINTGLVVVGSIGTDLRMDYTAIGDTTNVAARLLQAADPKRILISEITFRHVEGYFHLRPLGGLSIKGKTDPVRAWEVISARLPRSRFEVEAARGLTPFVGRSVELQILTECFSKAAAGHGQVVFITGDPGIGKSRLLYQLRRRLGDQATWVEGHSLSYGRSIALNPLVDLLKRNFAIEEADSDDAIARKIERSVLLLGDDLRSTLPFLRYLLSIDPGDPAVQSMDPKARRGEIFNAVRRLTLRACEVRPQVVVIEDIHWMDKATEEYLLFMHDSIPAVRGLLILTYRTGYTQPLADRSFHTRITLEDLSGEESIQIANAILGAQHLSFELRDLIVGKAEGNPFFVEEIIKSLREAGALQGMGSHYGLAHRAAGISVPETIQDLLMARIDRLPDGPKRTLHTAAVIGRDFSLRLLQRALGEETLDEYLVQLKSLEFIYEKRQVPDVEYTFRHSLTQEVAYESLLHQRRRELHGLIARTVAEVYADRLEEFHPVLGHHYLRSNEADRAIEHLVKAGDRAVRLYANAEATSHYSDALTQIEKDPHFHRNAATWIDIVIKLCGVSGASADFERDLRHLARAAPLAERLADPRRQGQVLYWTGRTYYVLGRVPKGIEYAEQALAIADALGDEAFGAMPLNLLARCYFVVSDFKKAGPILERSGKQLEYLGNRIEAAPMYGGLGWSLAMLGEFERALEMAEHALALAHDAGHLPTLAACYHYRAATRLPMGDFGPAIEDLRHALALAEQIRDPFRVYMATGFLGAFLGMAGEWDAAAETLDRTFTTATRLGTKLYASLFRVFRAELSLARCELAEAVQYCREAMALATEANDRWSEAWARRLLGTALGQGDPPTFPEAEQEIREAIRLQRELGILPDLARSLLALGRVLELKGDRPAAQEAVTHAAAMFRQMRMDAECMKAEALIRTEVARS